MSLYERPLRSDELMHWGKGTSAKKHKYLYKVGNRYFYTKDEYDAYKGGSTDNFSKLRENARRSSKSKGKLVRVSKSPSGSVTTSEYDYGDSYSVITSEDFPSDVKRHDSVTTEVVDGHNVVRQSTYYTGSEESLKKVNDILSSQMERKRKKHWWEKLFTREESWHR